MPSFVCSPSCGIDDASPRSGAGSVSALVGQAPVLDSEGNILSTRLGR